MKMFFVSTSAKSVHGRLIKLITGGKYNHSLVMFQLDSGGQVYFESYWKKDKTTGKTGMIGPIPYMELLDWSIKKPGRIIHVHEMPYSPKQCQKAYSLCFSLVGKRSYAHYQLIGNAVANLFNLGRPKSSSPNAWTCSEAVARIWGFIDSRAVLDYLRIGDIRWDQVTPSGKAFGLDEAIERFINESVY